MLPHSRPVLGSAAARRGPTLARPSCALRVPLKPRPHAAAAIALAFSIPIALYVTAGFNEREEKTTYPARKQRTEAIQQFKGQEPSPDEKYRFQRPPRLPSGSDGDSARGGEGESDSESADEGHRKLFFRRFVSSMRGRERSRSASRNPAGRVSAAHGTSSLRYKLPAEDDEADLNIIPVALTPVERTADLDDADVDREIDGQEVHRRVDVGVEQHEEAPSDAVTDTFQAPLRTQARVTAEEEDDGSNIGSRGRGRMHGRVGTGGGLAVEEEELAEAMADTGRPASHLSHDEVLGSHVHSVLYSHAFEHATAAAASERQQQLTQSGKKPHPLAAYPAARVVYDVVQETHGKSLMMCPCHAAHASWVRPLVSALEREISGFQFFCIDHSPNRLARALAAGLAGDGASMAGSNSVLRRVNYWEQGAPLPKVDVVLAFGGIELVQSGRMYSFLSSLRRSAGARDVLVGHFSHVARDDPAHGAWIRSLRRQHLHTRNIHNLLRSPFMFPTPKRSYEGLDPLLPQKELLWYNAVNLVNRFA